VKSIVHKLNKHKVFIVVLAIQVILNTTLFLAIVLFIATMIKLDSVI
jgi:hypothetical protein